MIELPATPPSDPGRAVQLCEPLCRGIAKHYFGPGLEYQDLVQAGRIGAWKAWRDWRPDGGRSYKSFSVVCIERQIITEVKTAQRRKHEVLSEAARFEHTLAPDTEGGTLADVVPLRSLGPHEHLLAREELKRLLWAQLTLSPLERAVIAGMFAGLSYDQIGQTLPTDVRARCSSAQGIRKSIDNALQRARRKLADEDTGAAAAAVGRRRRLVYVPRRERSTPYGAPTAQRAIWRARMQVDATFLDAEVVECVKRAIAPDGRERRDTRGRPRPDGRRPIAVWRIVLETSDVPELWAA